MAIAGRIRIDVPTDPFMDESFPMPALDVDAWQEAQHEDLLAQARELAGVQKLDVIRVEVEYPSEREPGKSWDDSGDAVEIDFRVEPPTVVTLPPYAEKAP